MCNLFAIFLSVFIKNKKITMVLVLDDMKLMKIAQEKITFFWQMQCFPY